MTTVQCPTCKKEVTWSEESPYRPFCSKRCQLIDLGAWASEEYRVPESQTQDEWSETSESIEIPRH
ncbi:DNA gyrase inhibitor YacG [Hahella sp. CCB-MM4]|uniref:DNA gyrase inhibitor YacG n=1 Tax=Hahella sp. (strain CCB-MM4) TaxID=1926491 RepID=UPI000B9A7D98|nr:DNA gyrase inhibitor YacG [Hahella sp. CCB-MM4]OZG70511.1 DNA gyrase inhibitor YacG [Hahella sp. CCB-MM4]